MPSPFVVQPGTVVSVPIVTSIPTVTGIHALHLLFDVRQKLRDTVTYFIIDLSLFRTPDAYYLISNIYAGLNYQKPI